VANQKMKFGVWLPSFAWPQDNTWEPARYLKEWCVKADHAGVDIWVIDHLLVAPGLYGSSWLEPMEMLTYAAAVTQDVKLATGILVLPVRNPVLLAKEIATLQVLSENRFILGAGPGWYKQEYEVTGTKIEERGKRTDEMLEARIQSLPTTASITASTRWCSSRTSAVCRTSGWLAGHASRTQRMTPTFTTRTATSIHRWSDAS
jgi:hypothetical protein